MKKTGRIGGETTLVFSIKATRQIAVLFCQAIFSKQKNILPYPPDLAFWAYFPFPKLKEFLLNARFKTMEEVKENMAALLRSLNNEESYLQQWKKRMR